MNEFAKILVGVDPQSWPGKLSAPVATAVKQAMRLAELIPCEITFFSVLAPQDEGELEVLPDEGEKERVASGQEAACLESLRALVEQSKERGSRATSKTAYGIGWIELTREAIDGRYDLVLVGTRNQGTFRRALFGSTAMKLLHNCPAPVWVAKPETHPTPTKVLVASDFSKLSDKALRLAVSIGSSCGAQVHLIHVVKQRYAQLSDTGEAETRGEEVCHDHDRAAANRRLNEQLTRVSNAASPVKASIADDTAAADYPIAKYAEANQIDLLVLGTNARQGLAGVFIGNTAERLLPVINCSLLVVKPDGFACPVCLESGIEPSRGDELAALI